MAEIMAEHLPPGVFNVVCGDRDTGRALVAHPIPAMVSITGSVRAGMEVAAAAAADLKRVHLELGGKAPVIVFDDADVARGRRGHRRRRLLQRRPGLHGRDPGAGRAPGARRPSRRAGRAGRGDDRRRYRRRRRRLRAAQQRRPSSSGCAGSSSGRRRTRRVADRRHSGRRPRLLLRSDGRRRPAPGRRDDPAGGVRAGHHRPAVRRRGRGARVGQRRRVRAGLVGLDAGPRPGHAHGPRSRLRVRVDQHPHPARGRDAPRRVQAVRLRQGPLGLRVRGLHAHQARDEQHRRSER